MSRLSLCGVDDDDLRSALADLASAAGVSVVADGQSAGIVLVLVRAPEQLEERLAAARAGAPGAMALVLAPLDQPHLARRALALGAVAFHGLDHPSEHLAATLRALLRPRVLRATGAGTP